MACSTCFSFLQGGVKGQKQQRPGGMLVMMGTGWQRGLFFFPLGGPKPTQAIGHLSQTTARPVKEKLDPVCGQGCKVAPLMARMASGPSQLDGRYKLS
ncbi:hypothetical protein J3E68DRAFT_26561 [Trichoderma sp. SZMC 28012]